MSKTTTVATPYVMMDIPTDTGSSVILRIYRRSFYSIVRDESGEYLGLILRPPSKPQSYIEEAGYVVYGPNDEYLTAVRSYSRALQAIAKEQIK